MKRSAFFYALFHPVNLAILALAVAAGACAAWWLLPVGVAFWLVMFVITLRDPRLRMILLPKSREPLAQRFQELFNRIEQARISVFNSMATAKAPVRRTLAPAQNKMDQLVNQSYQVFRQMSALENHRLVNRMNSKSDDTLAQTEQKLASATDSSVKRDLEEARQVLEKRQAQVSSISAVLDRADAQFASLAASVDGIVTRFISLQAADTGQAKQELPKLLEIIQAEMDALTKFSQEVNNEAALS
ncbi:MAG: V-type ATPase subunit subunit G family protein [Anaerolineales bacterium]